MMKNSIRIHECPKDDSIEMFDFLYIDKNGIVHSVIIDDYGIWRGKRRMVSFMEDGTVKNEE